MKDWTLDEYRPKCLCGHGLFSLEQDEQGWYLGCPVISAKMALPEYVPDNWGPLMNEDELDLIMNQAANAFEEKYGADAFTELDLDYEEHA